MATLEAMKFAVDAGISDFVLEGENLGMHDKCNSGQCAWFRFKWGSIR